MGDHVDQAGDAERVRPEDELVAAAAADPTGLDEDIDASLPLVGCQPHLDDEVVQVPDEGLHDDAQPCVFAAVEATHHVRGQALTLCNG